MSSPEADDEDDEDYGGPAESTRISMTTGTTSTKTAENPGRDVDSRVYRLSTPPSERLMAMRLMSEDQVMRCAESIRLS